MQLTCSQFKCTAITIPLRGIPSRVGPTKITPTLQTSDQFLGELEKIDLMFVCKVGDFCWLN